MITNSNYNLIIELCLLISIDVISIIIFKNAIIIRIEDAIMYYRIIGLKKKINLDDIVSYERTYMWISLELRNSKKNDLYLIPVIFFRESDTDILTEIFDSVIHRS